MANHALTFASGLLHGVLPGQQQCRPEAARLTLVLTWWESDREPRTDGIQVAKRAPRLGDSALKWPAEARLLPHDAIEGREKCSMGCEVSLSFACDSSSILTLALTI